MTYSFNLIDQPWIPCAQLDGRVTELSLRGTLEKAHELRGLQGDSPLETAAMYRLLLAVIHSALRGPANKTAWAKLWDAKRWDMKRFDKYLEEWHDHFDLFDKERPFYQVKANKNGRQKFSNDVMPDVASGTNATLFSHSIDENNILLSPAKATRILLVMQTMSVAGGWGMAPKESSDAPWGRGVIFLVEDDNLFKILMLNLLKYPDNEIMRSGEDDAPVWEMKDPFKPKRDQPLGYLDYLTWQNRRVALIPEGDEKQPLVREMTISQGLKLDPTTLDPMKHYRIDEKKGFLCLRFSEARALWRDSSALFKVQNQTTARPPHSFFWLANLADDNKIDKHHFYRFMALGMSNDQAKIDFYRHETFPLPLDYLQQKTLIEQLSDALLFAENTNRSLKFAGKVMAFMIVSRNSGEKPINKIPKDHPAHDLYRHWGVDRFFWSKLETPFNEFLQTLPNDSSNEPSAMDRWKEMLQQTAWGALAGAERFAGESTTALKAAVKARGTLAYELKKLFSEIQIQKEAVNE